MSSLPTGTVTFLFTDIEDSTTLAQAFPADLPKLLARHHALLRQAIEHHNGLVFQITGDAFAAAFPTAADALNPAIEAQRSLLQEPWHPAPVKVRIGLHTGAAQTRGLDTVSGGYEGYSTLARTNRVMAIAHGGQILLSNPTAELVRAELPPGVTLRDLGLHRLKGVPLPEHLWQPLASDLEEDFPPLQSLIAAPHNLPAQLTSFVGRQREIEKITQLIANNRLVTLTGAGGSGKTRLALQAANSLVDAFRDGVWWVGLVALNDPTLVAQAAAKALDVREVPNQPLSETLANAVKSKQLLFLLDNCEHLIDACAQLAESLLQSCPNLKILATSREGLDVAGESVYQVPTLSLPHTSRFTASQVLENEATRLFFERALAVRSDYTLNDQTAACVEQICRRLDGIPLAIELAAARVKVLSTEEIAARLDDRFELLTGGSRTALPRHQTLRATLDWSYDLLTHGERILFRRLSVFAGGFTVNAAKTICSGDGLESAQVLDLLSRLVDKSLVVIAERGIETRFRMLETIREYARETLQTAGKEDVLRDRHLQYFALLAEQAEPQIFGAEQAAWFDRLDQERDNLLAAIDWSLEGGSTLPGLILLSALYEFWFARGHLSEILARLKRALERPDAAERTATRAKALNALGFFDWEDLSLFNPRSQLEEALSISTELGDRSNIATALRHLGLLAYLEGNDADASSLLEQSLAIGRELNTWERVLNSQTLHFLGDVLLMQGDIDRAAAMFEESIVILADHPVKTILAYGVRRLGQLASDQGNVERAYALCKESLVLNMEVTDQRGVIACLAALAGIELLQDRLEAASKLFGAVRALLDYYGMKLLPADEIRYNRNLATLRESLGEAAFQTASAEGRAMTLEQAVDYALNNANK